MRYKVVLSVEAHGDEEKRKVLQAVTSRLGIDHVYTDRDGKKLTVTVIGSMDPIDLGNKLKKHWRTDMVKMAPVEEPKKEIVPVKKEIVPAKKINQENLPKNNVKKAVVKKEPEMGGKAVRVREREVHYQVLKLK